MSAVICDSKAKADAYAAAVDAKMGYPRVGKMMGSGNGRFTQAELTTLTHAAVIAHPTLPNLFAYPDAAAGQDSKGAQVVPLPSGATVTTLDATWTPAPVVIATVDEPVTP